jgi:hypothetical protein
VVFFPTPPRSGIAMGFANNGIGCASHARKSNEYSQIRGKFESSAVPLDLANPAEP